MCVCAKLFQLYPTLCDPMVWSSPGSSVQAWILEWVAISFSRESSQTRDRTWDSYAACIGRRVPYHSVQFSSVAQSCLTLCDPMNCSMPDLPSITNSWSLPKLMSIELVMPSSHLILCRPLLLLPPIPPSIRIFSNESTLRIRWPKYWSFSFSLSPSNEHPGLISFRMDWLDLLAVLTTSTTFNLIN